VNFWNQHTVLFVIGLVLWPRMLLIYFGLLPPMTIPPILGMIFVPRLFLAGTMTAMYWDTNPILVTICWIMAGVLDLPAIAMKWKFQSEMLSNWHKTMNQ